MADWLDRLWPWPSVPDVYVCFRHGCSTEVDPKPGQCVTFCDRHEKIIESEACEAGKWSWYYNCYDEAGDLIGFVPCEKDIPGAWPVRRGIDLL